MKRKEKNFKKYRNLFTSLTGILLFAVSCGKAPSAINETEAETTSLYIESLYVETEPYSSAEAETWEWETGEIMEEIVNIEEADITHDGVPDKIVSYIRDRVFEGEEPMTAKERLNRMGECVVRVYDGTALSEDETFSPEDCIWECSHATPHVGNGQLYLTERDGESFFIENSDYMNQGMGIYGYHVFYLEDSREKIVAEDQLNFYLSAVYPPDAILKFVETALAYTKGLEKELEGSKLLVYCSVGQEARLRTFDEACSARAEEIWLWAFEENDKDTAEEITMENLPKVLEAYYKIE